MNYHHSYHAGNFADVFKHTVLVSLIESLQRKENGFCYLDTHAGEGLYDLSAKAAQQSKEYMSGIHLLMNSNVAPRSLQTYLACIERINSGKLLRYYPGSPLIAQTLLRPQDRMVLAELHPLVYQTLKNRFVQDKRIGTHHIDGYQSLKAFLPPKERRALILIDPPYEQTNELAHITHVIPSIIKRFTTGVYAIWYPIKDRPPIERFHQMLKTSIAQPILVAELSIYPETSAQHLNGSGMIIINPPWELDKKIMNYLPELWTVLSPNKLGQQQIFNLSHS